MVNWDGERNMINHLSFYYRLSQLTHNRWKEMRMNYFTKESSHSGKKRYEKKRDDQIYISYIFMISFLSHKSTISFYFILLFVWEQVRGGLQWKEIQTEQLRWKSIQCPWWEKMKWEMVDIFVFVRNELLLILFNHLISLSHNLFPY